MPETLLRTQDLATGYSGGRKGRHVVSTGLELSLRAGEFAALIGPNGSGKSTLIKTLTGGLAPLSGGVFIQERDLGKYDISELARTISVTLTETVTPIGMTARALVALGRFPYTNWLGKLGPSDHRAIDDALRAAHCADLAERYAHELSDGEKQKVMIARALAQQPKALILDEPTSFLDLPRRVELTRVLARLARERKIGVLCSTHDLDLALRTADTLWIMFADGSVRSGAPEDLALSGALGAAFADEHVAFDRATGQFAIHDHPSRFLRVEGEGAAAFWACRAVERAGFGLCRDADAPALATLVPTCPAGEGGWDLRTGDGVVRAETLRRVVEILRDLP